MVCLGESGNANRQGWVAGWTCNGTEGGNICEGIGGSGWYLMN